MRAISLQTYEDTSSSRLWTKATGALAWIVNGMAVIAALIILMHLWLPDWGKNDIVAEGLPWRAALAVETGGDLSEKIAVPVGERPRIRDPFRPSDLETKRKRKRRHWSPLHGLMMRNDRPYALINNQVVGLGEWVLGMRVINIQQNRVVLANHRKIRILYLY